MKHILSILLFCLINSVGLAQEFRKLNGLIFNEDREALEQINIINQTHLNGSTSNKDGFFSISVRPGDTILFSSVNFENQHIIVTDSVLERSHVEVFLKLDEVNLPTIDLSSFSMMDTNKTGGPVKMSLPFKHDVVYKKPSQRKYESLNFNGVNFLGTLVTALNGEKKKLKGIMAKENEDERFKKIRKRFDNDFYTRLGIPEDQINQFIDFYFPQAEIENLFRTENTFKLIELIKLKSVAFLEELKDEK